MFYVYILQCNDDSFYTGHTDDLDKELTQHSQDYFSNCCTAKLLPVALVYHGGFDTRERALIVEKQVKGWSRKKKQALINDDWLEIARLSRAK